MQDDNSLSISENLREKKVQNRPQVMLSSDVMNQLDEAYNRSNTYSVLNVYCDLNIHSTPVIHHNFMIDLWHITSCVCVLYRHASGWQITAADEQTEQGDMIINIYSQIYIRTSCSCFEHFECSCGFTGGARGPRPPTFKTDPLCPPSLHCTDVGNVKKKLGPL